jgi:type VI secretion system protein ImpE
LTTATTAEENVRAGKLDEALAALQDQVRRQPADARLRTFLFQLLALRGQWERALTQLQVSGELDAKGLVMVQAYREALRCEALRAEVFAGRRTPLLFGQPSEWMALLLQALKLGADEKHAEAQKLRERAFEDAPATAGRIDDQPFAWIADADQRLGPILEAVVNGRYYWIPFHRLREVRLEKPVDLRDLVWTPAQLVYANGGETVALIPSRYPGSEASGDNRLVMGRATEWREQAGGSHVGMGQRLLVTDQAEYGLLDVRKIQLEGVDDGAALEAPGAADANADGGPAA